MADVIQLLPDSVANQIAAGEVIQRPASVVKELVENAVDSGADSILVNVKDSGKTLIQVIDNGCGMSETDARLCWERHATSKIRVANDLFSIHTMGFRGEALASIAAVAEVSLKTRRKEDDLGTFIRITASEIISNEPIACSAGSNFSVKNLFFNVPARRRFLKSNTAELRHIITEFNHVALACPDIDLSLVHNNSNIYNLTKSNLRQRIISIYGKHLNQILVPVEIDTTLVKITGFIGKPEFAKKTYGEQFLFANGRFIKQPYFHKAITQAYDQLIAADALPSYFIYFQIDPQKIDINIHPTKTEVKFEDETAIWQMLHAVVKESIGRFNFSPSLDFGIEGVIDIPTSSKGKEIYPPKEYINPVFNPFEQEKKDPYSSRNLTGHQKDTIANWEKLYTQKLDAQPSDPEPELIINTENTKFLQFKNRFILTPVKSGLMIIDQKRAHERILYEDHLRSSGNEARSAQQSLYPEIIELSPPDYVVMGEILDNINSIGFDIRDLGNNSIVINGLPSDVKNTSLKDLIDEMLEVYKSYEGKIEIEAKEKIARSVARASAIPYGKVLEQEEMRELVDQLFACSNPNFSPTGKTVLKILGFEEIEKLLR